MTLHEVLMSSLYAVVLGNAQGAAHELIYMARYLENGQRNHHYMQRKSFIKIFCTFWRPECRKNKNY